MDTVGYEELLARDGMVITHVVGNSMEPLLHDRQSIVVVESTDRVQPKKNDVVLYRKDGTYILHRILTENSNCFIIRGDNGKIVDHIKREEILGVMTAFFRTPQGSRHERGGIYNWTYSCILPLIHWAGQYWIKLKRLLQH